MDVYKPTAKTFPLVLTADGERVRIAALRGGRNVDRRLTELGLPVGSELTVMHNQLGGPIVVAHKDTRTALGAGIAHRIMVSRTFDVF